LGITKVIIFGLINAENTLVNGIWQIDREMHHGIWMGRIDEIQGDDIFCFKFIRVDQRQVFGRSVTGCWIDPERKLNLQSHQKKLAMVKYGPIGIGFIDHKYDKYHTHAFSGGILRTNFGKNFKSEQRNIVLLE
jgi:hypothetical protein